MKKLKHLLAIFAVAAFLGGCATGGDPAADSALNAKVQSALKSDQYVSKFHINSTADADTGTVVLSGNVDNSFQSYSAGATAKKVDGVKKVENKIKVE